MKEEHLPRLQTNDLCSWCENLEASLLYIQTCSCFYSYVFSDRHFPFNNRHLLHRHHLGLHHRLHLHQRGLPRPLLDLKIVLSHFRIPLSKIDLPQFPQQTQKPLPITSLQLYLSLQWLLKPMALHCKLLWRFIAASEAFLSWNRPSFHLQHPMLLRHLSYQRRKM